MLDKEFVIRAADKALSTSGNYLVDVQISPDNRVVIEIDNDSQSVSIDDCARLSRDVREAVGEEADNYEWEVGSAGLTAPFKVFRQYLKHIGKEVEVGIKDGRKLTGILKSAAEDRIVLTVERQEKIEGSKRKQTVKSDVECLMNTVNYTKHIIRFK
jgi:ribosome maturation factor RimP